MIMSMTRASVIGTFVPSSTTRPAITPAEDGGCCAAAGPVRRPTTQEMHKSTARLMRCLVIAISRRFRGELEAGHVIIVDDDLDPVRRDVGVRCPTRCGRY